MGLRETLIKARGLLIESEPTPGSPAPGPAPASEVDRFLDDLERGAPAPARRTVEQVVRQAEGPNLDEIQAPPVVSPDGQPDFAAIYAQAKLPPAPFTAEQMLEMLASLPAELPLETRRQTVRVSLEALGKSIGVSAESIVTDASRKLAALASCAENLSRQTADRVAGMELEIAGLQAQVEEKRRAIQAAQQTLARVTEACGAESDRLDDVLEFFSLDLPPSKYAAGP